MLNVRLAGDHLFGKLLYTWLSLVLSMVMSFCAVLFPTRCLGWDLELNWVSFWGFSFLLLCMGVLPKLFKLWPWVDLDPFYAKVKFGHKGFCMGKTEKNLFFGNYCSLGSLSCLKHLAKWVNEVEWVSNVKVILWPWSKVTQISKLKLVFLKTVGQFGTKVHMKAWGGIGMKIYINELGHLTNMASMPIYGRNLKNLLLQNQ